MMGAIEGFLSNYSSNFKMALLVWPFFSLMLTLPILAYLYHRDGRLKPSNVVATYLAVLYALGIVCFTLYPLPQGTHGPGITYGVPVQLNPLGFVGDIAKDGLRAVFQLAFNVVFFMPLGFIAGRLLRMRFVSALVLSAAASCLIELAQLTGLFGLYDYSYRCCDVDDVICNTLGGVLGWLGARALGSQTKAEAEEPALALHPGLIRRVVAFWIDLSIVYVVALMPWGVVDLVCELLLGEPFRIIGLTVPQTSALCITACGLVAFAVCEVVVPWMRSGSTPGGSFVRMTCESGARTLGNRILFYVLRTITIVVTLVLPYLMVPILGIYWLAKRCMPYDGVPLAQSQERCVQGSSPGAGKGSADVPGKLASSSEA